MTDAFPSGAEREELYEGLEASIVRVTDAVHRVNAANGWFEDERPFAADIALLHSEVSEAFESYRRVGSVTSNEGVPFGSPFYDKDAGAAELADVLIRLLDTCKRYDIDLARETLLKLEYNAGRGYRHGGKAV